MAQVPYSPVPNVVPTVPGLPRVGIETPPAAFGAATAAAVRGLGQQTEQSSNEMFQTALYVQQLQNDTRSKDDFVKASGALGDAEMAFRANKGADAVNAYPGFKQQVMQIYQSALDQSPNPQARRMLADALSRRVTYSIEDGGRHAGEQNQQYVTQTNTDIVARGASDSAAHPESEGVYRQAAINARSAARALSPGMDSSMKAEKFVGEIAKARLVDGFFNDPQRGLAILDANQKLPDDDPTKISAVYAADIRKELQRRNNEVGASAHARRLLSDMSPDSGPEYEEKKLQQAREEGEPYGDEYQDHLIAKVKSDYNTFHNVYRQEEHNAFSRLMAEISGSDGGAPVTDRSGIFNNPARYDLYRSLEKTPRGLDLQRQVLAAVDHNSEKGTLPAIAQQNLVDELKGLAVSAQYGDQTARDQLFARIGDAYPQVDQGQRKVLSSTLTNVQKAWASGRATQDNDPTHLAGVMHTLGNFLLSNNVDPQANDGKYYRFQGMVYDRLQQMVAGGEKIPTNPEQLEKLFGPLIKNLGLSQDLRASTPAPQVQFTGRTASAPGKPTLRETTTGQWVP